MRDSNKSFLESIVTTISWLFVFSVIMNFISNFFERLKFRRQWARNFKGVDRESEIETKYEVISEYYREHGWQCPGCDQWLPLRRVICPFCGFMMLEGEEDLFID